MKAANNYSRFKIREDFVITFREEIEKFRGDEEMQKLTMAGAVTPLHSFLTKIAIPCLNYNRRGLHYKAVWKVICSTHKKILEQKNSLHYEAKANA